MPLAALEKTVQIAAGLLSVLWPLRATITVRTEDQDVLQTAWHRPQLAVWVIAATSLLATDFALRKRSTSASTNSGAQKRPAADVASSVPDRYGWDAWRIAAAAYALVPPFAYLVSIAVFAFAAAGRGQQPCASAHRVAVLGVLLSNAAANAVLFSEWVVADGHGDLTLEPKEKEGEDEAVVEAAAAGPVTPGRCRWPQPRLELVGWAVVSLLTTPAISLMALSRDVRGVNLLSNSIFAPLALASLLSTVAPPKLRAALGPFARGLSAVLLSYMLAILAVPQGRYRPESFGFLPCGGLRVEFSGEGAVFVAGTFSDHVPVLLGLVAIVARFSLLSKAWSHVVGPTARVVPGTKDLKEKAESPV